MATWVVCTQCGKVQETTPDQQIPEGWHEIFGELHCPTCSDTATGDVLEEEILYPSQPITGDVREEEILYPSQPITLDEDVVDFCEICKGPCQGH